MNLPALLNSLRCSLLHIESRLLWAAGIERQLGEFILWYSNLPRLIWIDAVKCLNSRLTNVRPGNNAIVSVQFQPWQLMAPVRSLLSMSSNRKMGSGWSDLPAFSTASCGWQHPRRDAPLRSTEQEGGLSPNLSKSRYTSSSSPFLMLNSVSLKTNICLGNVSSHTS